jgi:hypothetical protein
MSVFNEVAVAVMEQRGIPVIDLTSPTNVHLTLSDDRAHFTGRPVEFVYRVLLSGLCGLFRQIDSLETEETVETCVHRRDWAIRGGCTSPATPVREPVAAKAVTTGISRQCILTSRRTKKKGTKTGWVYA